MQVFYFVSSQNWYILPFQDVVHFIYISKHIDSVAENILFFPLMVAVSVVMSHFLLLILGFWGTIYVFLQTSFIQGFINLSVFSKKQLYLCWISSVLIFAFLFYLFLFLPLTFTFSYFYQISFNILSPVSWCECFSVFSFLSDICT